MKVGSALGTTAGAVLALGLVIGTAGGAGAAGAGSSATDVNGDGVITEVNRLIMEPATVSLIPSTGKLLDTEALSSVTQVIDAATGDLLRTGRAEFAASAAGGADSTRDCVKNGHSKKLVKFPVANRYLTGQAGVVHFQYHPYMLPNARTIGSRPQTQFEVCATGGGDLQDGWRFHKVGAGMALADSANFRKIGQSWKTGKTPEDYTLGLGFAVAPKQSPIEISASLTQNPSDKLLGSIVGPYKSYLDAYARNGVNAWWQDSCVGAWHGCRKWHGSADFQGAIAQGLWEYPTRELPPSVRFFFQPHVEWACHGAVKCG